MDNQLTVSQSNVADKIKLNEINEELLEACELFYNCEFNDALPMFRELADDGNSYAMYFLSLYSNIDSELVSEKEGEFWRKLGAIKENILCKSWDVYQTLDLYLDTNDDEAINYFDKMYSELLDLDVILAETETDTIIDVYYAYQLAINGLDKELLIELADLGCWNACVQLGYDLIDEDKNKSIEYFTKAIECGYTYAFFDIGRIYDDLEDFETAKEYYEKYYELELPFADAVANRLGILSAKNNDKENAIKWYERSCEMGNDYAYSNLALQLSDSNPHKAIDLYKQAFEIFDEKDFEEAAEIAHEIALLYLELDEIEQVFEWDKKSAEYGNPWGMNGLGMLYKYCFDEPEYELAIYWLQKAVENGVEDAQEELDDFMIELKE